MNRLELANRWRQEAGVQGTYTTTVGQTGMAAKGVNWIDSAYEDIQRRHSRWDFLRTDFTFNTIESAATYTPTAAGLSDLNEWKKDSFRCYLDTVTDEQWLDCYDWSFFRDSRLLGANRSVEGRPTEFAVKPDKSLSLWAVPDDEYTIVGEYWKVPEVMSGNTGEPNFPDQFHMAIVWRALMFFAASEEATYLYSHAEKEFLKSLFTLEMDQLWMSEEAETLA